MNRIRTAEDSDRFRAALVPVDRAMWESEQRWGVGRLERLQSPVVLLAYKRGWDQYRVALDEGDASAIETIGPKMIAALAFMSSEAEAAGHKPIAPDTWEAPLCDGTVLVVVRTGAEASAVLRAARAADGASYETTLPPDLAVTVRNQHEGRALTIWSMAEIARLIEAVMSGVPNGAVSARVKAQSKIADKAWSGTPTHTGTILSEGSAAEMVRTGYPLPGPLTLDF